MSNEQTPEAILDSARGLLQWYQGQDRPTVGSLKFHLRHDEDAVAPEGLLLEADESYVTTEEFADILYRTFKAAEERE